jgi:hypothetical protein
VLLPNSAKTSLGKRFDDFTRWCMSPIRQISFGCREGVLTSATRIALLSGACSAELDDVPLRCGLRLPVISAISIGTEIARLD